MSAVLSGYRVSGKLRWGQRTLQHLRFVINSSFTYFHAHSVRYQTSGALHMAVVIPSEVEESLDIA